MTSRRIGAIAAGLVIALAACGGNGGNGGENGDGTTTTEDHSAHSVSLTATEFEFDPSAVTVDAGAPITITLENAGVVEHDFVIDGMSFDLLTQPGDSSDATQTFDAGTYTFYCSVPGHREAGMEGTLTAE